MPRKIKPKSLLAIRPTTHGPFTEVAGTAQALENVLSQTTNWPGFSPVRRMVLKEIAHKLARIGAGDPSHTDHWDDIGGYLELGKRDGSPAKAKPRKYRKAVKAAKTLKAAALSKAVKVPAPPKLAKAKKAVAKAAAKKAVVTKRNRKTNNGRTAPQPITPPAE
jgi:hypothetical protein